MMWRWMVVLVGVHAFLLEAEALLTTTFDLSPPAGGNEILPELMESGMTFSTDTVFFHRASGYDDIYPSNGTDYLAFASLMEPLVISNALGLTFDLVSVDASEYSVLNNAMTVPVVGWRPDGSSVSTVLSLDGIQDGTGPQSDFQTFGFGSEFTGLTHVEIATVGYALDNVTVSIVPEPAGALLLLAGFGLLRVVRGRRKPLQSRTEWRKWAPHE